MMRLTNQNEVDTTANSIKYEALPECPVLPVKSYRSPGQTMKHTLRPPECAEPPANYHMQTFR